ncbi:hypothetical protein PMIN01_01065 [Paraphaeosphaeria minitans]|uniref:Uncharacterized protein n=1 Tax=Paraphaeosphaeria minitans TaxID=565426 RepID=A0A9P6GUA2_9PLEO|nr:hypothetical protein PMIN01_01065 [Paraphaeosphaeria minitans]
MSVYPQEGVFCSQHLHTPPMQASPAHSSAKTSFTQQKAGRRTSRSRLPWRASPHLQSTDPVDDCHQAAGVVIILQSEDGLLVCRMRTYARLACMLGQGRARSSSFWKRERQTR